MRLHDEFFLCSRFESALKQNETLDVFESDFSQLGDDDAIIGNKTDTVKKDQSFTDINYSKNKVISCVDWHPNLRGISIDSVA